MATVSFNNQASKTAAPAEVPAAPATQQLVVVANDATYVDNGVEGEISPGDIRLPRINLVQRVGDLCNDFHPGSFLFNKEVLLSEGKNPIEITALRLKKVYQQNLPYGSQETPVSFNTAAEMQEFGGSLVYGADNPFGEVAHVQVAIVRPVDCPEEMEALFHYDFNGKCYALAIWTLKSSGFTSVGKTLITAANTLLRSGLHTGKYMLTSELRKKAQNSWFVPLVKFAGKHSAEEAAFLAGLK